MPTDPNPDDPVDIPISPGTTWMDEAGNTWTTFGSLVMSDDSIQTVRQNLINFLRGEHGRWQWYDYPPDVLKPMCVVVNPSDPYILPYTTMDGSRAPGSGQSVVWGLDLVMIVQRAKPEQALRRLEFMFTEIQESLQHYPQVQWLTFGEIGGLEHGGIEYLSGTLSLAIISTFNQ